MFLNRSICRPSAARTALFIAYSVFFFILQEICSAQDSTNGDSTKSEMSIANHGNKTRIEEIRKELPKMFLEGVGIASTIDDVIHNDARRRGNLRIRCPERMERSKLIVDFVNIPRPQTENDIIFEYIRNLYASEHDEKKLIFRLEHAFSSISRFCTNDILLWGIAKESVENFVESPGAEIMICEALRFMGMCRVPEAKAYFTDAVTKEYWERLKKASGNPTLTENLGMHSSRHGAVFAVTNLPVEEAIPILEALIKQLNPKDSIYEVTWRALDEMWRRKKGDPPLFIEYGTRYEYHDAEARPSAYPEWIYGVGGEKIEWPFGKPPSGYAPPRVHIDPF